MLESAVQQRLRLELARMGALPMRNNVGVAFTDDNRVIRFGLMNSSKQENDRFKSSDIIAPVPVVIEQRHVGMTLGLFGAFEAKHSDWHLTPGDARAQAQQRFIDLVRGVGGVGGFITGEGQVQGLLP